MALVEEPAVCDLDRMAPAMPLTDQARSGRQGPPARRRRLGPGVPARIRFPLARPFCRAFAAEGDLRGFELLRLLPRLRSFFVPPGDRDTASPGLSTPIARRPASVMASVTRWPSEVSRQLTSDAVAGRSAASFLLISVLNMAAAASASSLSFFGSGRMEPSSRLAAAARMMSWVSVSLGMVSS